MHRALHSECTEVCLKRATGHASGELISVYSCLTEYRYTGKRGSSVPTGGIKCSISHWWWSG